MTTRLTAEGPAEVFARDAKNNVLNASRIATVVVCVLTSNMKRAGAPGNVVLKKGEANLKKDSVAHVSQLVAVDQADLLEKIGTLSPAKKSTGHSRRHRAVDRTARPSPSVTFRQFG